MSDPMDEEVPGQHGPEKIAQSVSGRGHAIVNSSNIFRAADAEMMELPEASRAQLVEQREKVEYLELQRTMKSIVVPVLDVDVRKVLRRLQEPITLFGEREMERRERLRKLLATMTDEQAQALAAAALEEQQVPEFVMRPKELFYTEGTETLRTSRLKIALFSLERASQRIAAEKRRQERILSDAAEAAMAVKSDELLEQNLRTIFNETSEVADERPVSSCQFSMDGSRLLTGSWSGTVRMWSVGESCTQSRSFRAHGDRITGVAWHPDARHEGSASIAVVTGSSDRTARLWAADGTLLRTLEGHTDRLGRVAFHPMGHHVATTSFDFTWRLWDAETGECLVEQEGHSRAVYCLAFQRDGALAVSGGLDAFGRVWDLRSGRSVMVLEGHVKAVLSTDFSPCGYLVATGSEDNTGRIFDLRRKGTLSVLPGHTSLLSQVKFDPGDGRYLLTSGYDGTSKLWCGKNFKLTKTLAGHDGKVMASDISPQMDPLIATVGFDRTLKLWRPRPMFEQDGMEA